MKYNWQQTDWPHFRYDKADIFIIADTLATTMGQAGGLLAELSEETQHDTIIEMMVTEAVKTSEIEGEYISRADVMSSIRNHLGMNIKPETVSDKRAKGAAQLMLAVRASYTETLREADLFHWHRLLLEGSTRVNVGMWRTHSEPMQVVSGVLHKPIIHFEAPPSAAVIGEMQRFITWFNNTAQQPPDTLQTSIIHAAIAHIYFETIHPFEDGNGRIGRALSEKALSQGLGRPAALSLSKAIESDKNAYYTALEQAQRSNEITPWLVYFIDMMQHAQQDAQTLVQFVLNKAHFFDLYGTQINDAQHKAVNRMLKEGPTGFEGGMNAKKYIAITGVSKATATRHLQHLCDIGAFKPYGAGRSTAYEVNLE